MGLSVWRRRATYLVAAGAPWIANAHVQLKRRSRGQRRATRQELLALWVSQSGRCALTGLPINGVPHLDHRVSASLGGGHTIDNLQWVHPMANLAKRDYSVAEFRRWLLAAADALRQKQLVETLF